MDKKTELDELCKRMLHLGAFADGTANMRASEFKERLLPFFGKEIMDRSVASICGDERQRDKIMKEEITDKQRLDWLESAKGHCGHSHLTYMGEAYFAHAETQGDKYCAGKTLREAIDAAIKEEQ